MEINCIHNNRCRYTNGFYCEDCSTFFNINSSTYRSDELLSSIWMVLNNINAERIQKNLSVFPDVEKMKDEIGIGKKHNNYEDIISRAEILMKKYNKDANSVQIILIEE